MFHQVLPRLYELKDCIADPSSSDAYFQNFELNLASSVHVKDVYLRWEQVLQELDDTAWQHLKSEARPRLTTLDKQGRGWQQLFDTLNEARAYRYLKSKGYSGLQFIPRSQQQGRRTPDIEGLLGVDRVLCEVKTINISDDETAFRVGPTKAGSLQVKLPVEFLNKLQAKIEEAKTQMLAFDNSPACLHLVYLNISFDDFMAECKEAYFKQIDDKLLVTPVSSIRLVVCNAHTAFYKPLKMNCADVDNID